MAKYINADALIKFLKDTRLRLPYDSTDFHTRDLMLLNFEQYVNLQPAVNAWISVKDRLPKQPPDRTDEYGRTWFTTGERYLVYDGKNVFEAHYCFQNKCFWYKDSLHPLENITHWMPLPDAPEGE